MEIARATEADLPFIMATERLPGYELLVGRWDEARHRTALADRRYAYFIGCEASQPIGFAILRDWASLERVTLIQRLAVATPGRGVGPRFLRALVDAVFRDTEAHRVWLGVFPDNTRARRAYTSVGFVEEGISRGSAFFGNVHRDEVVMSVLRPEWESAKRAL